jgi:hypothetical protein
MKKGMNNPFPFSVNLSEMHRLKYNIMEKQAYALVKALKSFRVYVLHSKIIAYVPSNTVKDMLVQPDSEGRRGKWIENILEYDVDLKPTKLIKGQGLGRLLVDSNCRALGMNYIQNQSDVPAPQNEDGKL